MRWWLRRSRIKESGTSKASATSNGSIEIGAGYVSVEPPDDADPVARQPDFFFGLAQRSGDVIGISILHAAARKRDLSGMRGQMSSALCQQHRHPVTVINQRHQDGRRGQRGAGRGNAGVQVMIAA